jgi:hypothetical protein
MKRVLGTALAFSAAVLMSAAVAAPVSASSHSHCVTRAEYHRLKLGYSPHHVTEILHGYGGKVAGRSRNNDPGYETVVKEYKVCASSYGQVGLTFEKTPGHTLRLHHKNAFFG